MTKKILIGHPHYCVILNQETVTGSQFYAEYIYNAFALNLQVSSIYFIVKAMDEIEKNRLERALALIRQILPLVEAAEKKFKSARNWGFLDMFGGGTLVDLIKHYKLNTAADIMNQISFLLQQLQAELRQVVIPVDFRMNTMTFATFADFLFDGILADTYMQSKIMKSLDQVRELKNRLILLEKNLSALKQRG